MTKEEYAEELDNKLYQIYGIMGHGGSYDKKDELLFKIIQLFIMKEKYELEKELAQPVHQGTWLCNTHTEVFPWKCSKCNYDTVARFNYCPNCGTKMGGDTE